VGVDWCTLLSLVIVLGSWEHGAERSGFIKCFGKCVCFWSKEFVFRKSLVLTLLNSHVDACICKEPQPQTRNRWAKKGGGRGKVMRVGRCEMNLNMKICALVSPNCNIFRSLSSPFVVNYTKVYAQCIPKTTVYTAKSLEVKVAIPTYIFMNSRNLCPALYCALSRIVFERL
jgi:hypothetical protein